MTQQIVCHVLHVFLRAADDEATHVLLRAPDGTEFDRVRGASGSLAASQQLEIVQGASKEPVMFETSGRRCDGAHGMRF